MEAVKLTNGKKTQPGMLKRTLDIVKAQSSAFSRVFKFSPAKTQLNKATIRKAVREVVSMK
ncbi:MAG: hypothetical protein ABI760_06730 [Ferruginibacter sp.]